MITETRKYSKDDAFYTKIPQPGKRCELCIKYKPVEGTNPPAGTCQDVFGLIEHDAVCDEFIAKIPNRKP